MRRHRKALAAVGVSALAAAGAVVFTTADSGSASSHREAPAILEDPTADNTDVYFFRSPERQNSATIIANWLPFQEPMGGPNFYLFSPDARYNLNVDRNGDGKWDLRYQYRFKTRAVRSAAAGYLYSSPAGTPIVRQVYDLFEVTRGNKGNERFRKIAANRPVAPNNTGPKSMPNYEVLRQQAVVRVRGGLQSFAGQADDPFFVDLGMLFDNVNLMSPGRPDIGTGNQGNGVDTASAYNVLSVALQVPNTKLTGSGNSIVGVYASTERPVKKLVGKGANKRLTTEWVQVSRLGNPLINEVVIPRFRKDAWNAGSPADDNRFSQFYRRPFVGSALNALFPQLNLNIPETGRTDIEAALLNGLDLRQLGLANNSTGKTKADLLRLNLATPVSENPAAMGALQGDPQGFPNGRRLTDDVVDIELRVIGGALFNLVGGEANKLPLGDGVNQNDVPFEPVFPYVAPAHDGFFTEPPHWREEPPAEPVGPLPPG